MLQNWIFQIQLVVLGEWVGGQSVNFVVYVFKFGYIALTLPVHRSGPVEPHSRGARLSITRRPELYYKWEGIDSHFQFYCYNCFCYNSRSDHIGSECLHLYYNLLELIKIFLQEARFEKNSFYWKCAPFKEHKLIIVYGCVQHVHHLISVLQARGYLQSLPYKPKQDWGLLYPKYAGSKGS